MRRLPPQSYSARSRPENRSGKPSGRSLGARVSRVTVVSPYFDAKLAFIKRLETELQPKECVVAVHPKFSDLPANARALSPRTRFVDVSGLDDGWAERCLHAKLYRFELANGRSVVVLGSANASAPAWLADGGDRNAELVVVHHDAEQLWKRLGLHRITTAPEVGKEGWSEIRTRKETKKQLGGQASPSLAIATSEGSSSTTHSSQVSKPTVFRSSPATRRPQRFRRLDRNEAASCVRAHRRHRAEATRLEVTPASGPKRVALVHHVSESARQGCWEHPAGVSSGTRRDGRGSGATDGADEGGRQGDIRRGDFAGDRSSSRHAPSLEKPHDAGCEPRTRHARHFRQGHRTSEATASTDGIERPSDHHRPPHLPAWKGPLRQSKKRIRQTPWHSQRKRFETRTPSRLRLTATCWQKRAEAR